MEANRELRTAWEFAEHTGTSIFLTGKAGTGKTTFLKTLKEHSSKRLIVVAPTGVAAINAAGVTIHSFFQLPPSIYVPGMAIKDRFDYSKDKRRIMRTLDMLVIDEISMVRADLLDAIDVVLRRFRDAGKPFGGVQLLMIGDLQQLTPVVTAQDEPMLSRYYDTPYFFGSRALQQVSYVTIQLTHVYRQQDMRFISILNHVRDGQPTTDDLVALNRRVNTAFRPNASEGYIRLTTHNNKADSFNEMQLAMLKGEKHTYCAEVKGEFPQSSYPMDMDLVLKVGAQVMFIKNDTSPLHRYYNGRIGHVVRLSDTQIDVLCPGDSEPITVEMQEWENTKYVINEQTRVIEPQVQGTFKHYPLRLAWAITIHKSQGLTFERAIIDAGQSFAPGQVYVALSRCKSLEGMVLATPITQQGIINDQRVDQYITRQEAEAARSIEALPMLKEEYYRHQLIDLFDFNDLDSSVQMVHRTLLEYFRGQPKLTDYMGTAVSALKHDVMDVAYKWLTVIRQQSAAALHDAQFLERVKRSAGYFLTAIEKTLGRAIELLKTATTQNKEGLRLMDERYKNLWLCYLAKDKLLRRMEEATFDVPTYMLAKQMALLDAMEVVSPGSGKQRARRKTRAAGSNPYGQDETAGRPSPQPKKAKTKEKKEPKPASFEITYQMFMAGKPIPEIAKERGFAESTIYGHLARFVKTGKLSADKVIPAEKVRVIRQTIARLPEDATLKELKESLPDDYTYSEICLVLGRE